MTATESSANAKAQGNGGPRLGEPGGPINLLLTPRERAALRSLQMGDAPWPNHTHAIWDELSELSLVLIEGHERRLTLTSWGRVYPT